jgi:hypothetical protein
LRLILAGLKVGLKSNKICKAKQEIEDKIKIGSAVEDAQICLPCHIFINN